MMLRPRSAKANARPMRKHPERLTVRVPQGNLVPNSLAAHNEIAYRESAPMLPPAITMSIFMIQPSFMISCRSLLQAKSSRVLCKTFKERHWRDMRSHGLKRIDLTYIPVKFRLG